MNFLDPTEWNDLENLAREHEVLTEESVKELHTRLRPYFLRRVKSEVLELPPKVRTPPYVRGDPTDTHAERGHCAGHHESAPEGSIPIDPK